MANAAQRLVYFLSNGTAITAETLGLSLLAQFPDHRFQIKTVPFVDSFEKANAVAEEIDQAIGDSGQLPIVICTMADDDLVQIVHRTKALIIDPFADFLPRLETVLAAQHHQPDQSHRIVNPSVYDSRIAAIDFAMQHDDGSKLSNYGDADIILVGVSRSGKTPSCLYLALQFGIKAANYPITEEDMGSDRLPAPVQSYRDKLYGLTTDIETLVSIRQARRPDSRYASTEQCRFELSSADEMFHRHRIPFINTARMSVEEIAARIIRDNNLQRIEST